MNLSPNKNKAKPAVLFSGQLTSIAERSSECGFKEDLDRKEFEYMDRIGDLNDNIEDIKQIIQLTSEQIESIKQHNLELQKNK
jgi:hypothetical protein